MENPIYKFMRDNGLTKKDEATFLSEYSDPNKAAQLHKFMVDNQLTTKGADDFYNEYFSPSKKKVSTGSSEPAGQPGKPSAPSFGQKITEKITNAATQIPFKTEQQTQQPAQEKKKAAPSKYFEVDITEPQDVTAAKPVVSPVEMERRQSISMATPEKIAERETKQRADDDFYTNVASKEVFKMPTYFESKEYASDITGDYLNYLQQVDPEKGTYTNEKYKVLKAKSKEDRTATDEGFLRQVESEAINKVYEANYKRLQLLGSNIDDLEKIAVTPSDRSRLDYMYKEYEKVSDSLKGLSATYDQNNLQYGKIAGQEMQSEEDKRARFEKIQAGEGKTKEFFTAVADAAMDGILNTYQFPKIMGDLMGDKDYDWSDEFYDAMSGAKSTLDLDLGAPLPQGTSTSDLPFAARAALVGGNAIGTMGIFVLGGATGGATKLGQRAATFATSFLTQESNYYQEALDGGMSPQDAAITGSYLAAQMALFETIIPDISYLNASGFKKGVISGAMQAMKSGLPTKEAAKLALKNALSALPENALIVGKNVVKSGGKEFFAEELPQNLAEDTAKEIINNRSQKAYFNDTFNVDNYVDAAIGSFVAAGGTSGISSIFSKPTPKSPVQEEVMRYIVENRDKIFEKGTDSDKTAGTEGKKQVDEAGEILDAMKGHSGWNEMSKQEQDHAFALAQQAEVMKKEQERMKKLRIPDEQKDAQIKQLEDEVNAMFAEQLEKQKQKKNDQENIQGVPSEVGVGQKPIAAKPVEVTSEEATPAGGVLQAQEEEVIAPQATEEAAPVAEEAEPEPQVDNKSVFRILEKSFYEGNDKRYSNITDEQAKKISPDTRKYLLDLYDRIAPFNSQYQRLGKILDPQTSREIVTEDQKIKYVTSNYFGGKGRPSSQLGSPLDPKHKDLVFPVPSAKVIEDFNNILGAKISDAEAAALQVPKTQAAPKVQEQAAPKAATQVQEQVTTEAAPKTKEKPTRKTRLAKLFETSEGEEAVPLIEQSLSESGIKVDVKDDADYNNDDRIKRSQGRGSEGMFVADDGTIILNRDKIKGEWGKTIVFHEGIHPVVNIIRNTDPKRYRAIVDGLKAEAARNNAVAKAAADIAASEEYQRRGPESIEDETVVETMARVATGDIDINTFKPSFREKFIEFMNDIAKVFGLRPILTNSPRVEVKRLAEQINKMLNEGGKISDVVGKKNVKEFQYTEPAAQKRAVSIAKGKESLVKYGLKKGVNTTRKIGEALEKRSRELYGIIARDDRSEKALKAISSFMADEVRFFVEEFGENSGKGWYGEKFQKGLDAMAAVFPEMKDDQNARDLFTMLVAITSDGTEVMQNFQQASLAYKNYKETGKMPTTAKAQRAESYMVNFRNIQELLDKYDGDIQAIKKELLTVGSISDLNQQRKAQGLDKLDTKWPASFKVPLAASIFGPKLGMFYANLSGMEQYPTLDRWWSRTFNRYRGTLIPQITRGYNKKGEALGIDRYREIAGLKDASEEEVLARIVQDHDTYEDKGYKKGTPAEKAANTLYKKLYVELNDAPFGAKDRQFMYDAFIETQKKLKRSGVNVTIADIQAILWYFEKNLYKKLGVTKPIQGISYEDAANKTFEKWKNAGNSFNYAIKESEQGETIDEVDIDEEPIPTAQPSKGIKRGSNLVKETYYEAGLTEDKNDYVFFHVSSAPKASIMKGIDSTKYTSLRTAREEKGLQYGVASYYTRPEDGERMVGGEKYAVRVPKGKVYPIDSDPMGYGEKAEENVPQGTPFRGEAVKREIADMAKKDGYQMIVGEWSYSRTGKPAGEIPEFRADALVPLKPTAEKPTSFTSNAEKGMERIPFPSQQSEQAKQELENIASEVSDIMSNKKKFSSKEYQIANDINMSGQVRENRNEDNEFKRDITPEEYDMMVKVLPKSMQAEAARVRGLLFGGKKKGQASKGIARTPKEFAGNVGETIDRIKAATSEDGATLNLDGTTYEDGGLVVPAGSLNVAQDEVTAEGLFDFLKDNEENISSDIFKIGLYKFPDRPEVSYDLNIVIPREYRDVALKFGELSGQESLFDLDTFENIKTGSDGKNPRKFTAQELAEIAKDLSEGRLPKIVSKEEIDRKWGEKKMIALTKRDELGTKADREIAAYASKFLNKFGPYTKANVVQIMNMSAEEKIKLINDTFEARVKKMNPAFREPGNDFYDQSVKRRDEVLALVTKPIGQPSMMKRTPAQIRQAVEDGVDAVEAAIADGMDPQQAVDENISNQDWYGDLNAAQKEQLNEILQDEFGTTASEPKLQNNAQRVADLWEKGGKEAKAEIKNILETDPELSYIYNNFPKITKQLQEQGLLTKTENCP